MLRLPALLLAAALVPVAPDRESPAPRERAAQDSPTSLGPSTTSLGPGARVPDAAAREALERGLAWLAREQAEEPDGSFPSGGVSNYARVGITALGTLAFMAAGSTPGRGPHGREVHRGVEYLLSRADRDPASPTHGYIADQADRKSQIHGHGLAALTLAQAYTQSPRTELARQTHAVLAAAVDLIQGSQGAEGGWYYQPTRSIQHEGSTTITVVQALRAARNAGLHVDAAVIAKALDYVERSQKPDGSFRYALGNEESSVALTAAAIATMNATGRYSGNAIADGYFYIQRELEAREIARASGSDELDPRWPFYERLYLTQALWQHSDPSLFDHWRRRELPRILGTQRADGSWHDASQGDVYATAVNCLFLALPDGMLPIFQR